jgi:hypothetical protein
LICDCAFLLVCVPLQLQGHRAELYSRLAKGFRDFLGHGQEGVLARLMAQDITPGFAAVSQQVCMCLSCLNPGAET